MRCVNLQGTVTLYLIFYTDLIVNIIVCFLYSLFNVLIR